MGIIWPIQELYLDRNWYSTDMCGIFSILFSAIQKYQKMLLPMLASERLILVVRSTIDRRKRDRLFLAMTVNILLIIMASSFLVTVDIGHNRNGDAAVTANSHAGHNTTKCDGHMETNDNGHQQNHITHPMVTTPVYTEPMVGEDHGHMETNVDGHQQNHITHHMVTTPVYTEPMVGEDHGNMEIQGCEQHGRHTATTELISEGKESQNGGADHMGHMTHDNNDTTTTAHNHVHNMNEDDGHAGHHAKHNTGEYT